MTKYDIIKDLSEGYSTQSQTANRFWLLLIVTSVVTFTARPDKDSWLIELPFTLGKVDIMDFYFIMIVLLCVLAIAFASAMIQAIRARKLIQNVIESMPETDRYLEGIHLQDIVDVTLKPTFNRVAPIAQFMHGKNQFFGGTKRPVMKMITSIFYSLLKLATFIFIYIIPVYSVAIGWSTLNSVSGKLSFFFPRFLLIALMALAGLSIFILFFGDIRYYFKVTRKITR